MGVEFLFLKYIKKEEKYKIKFWEIHGFRLKHNSDFSKLLFLGKYKHFFSSFVGCAKNSFLKFFFDCVCQVNSFLTSNIVGLLSEALTIANLQNCTSRTWICSEPELMLSWIKFCSSDNQYNRVPPIYRTLGFRVVLKNQWFSSGKTQLLFRLTHSECCWIYCLC